MGLNNIFDKYITVNTDYVKFIDSVINNNFTNYDEDEIKKVLENSKTCDIYLNNRILRAETAVIAALSCWQAVKGDW